jgi:STE24 endopeptidase
MYYLTITIVLALFILNLTLSILDYQHRNHPIPKNVAAIYNKEEYQKWLNYKMENFRLSTYTRIVNTSVLILFLSFNFFPKMARFTEDYSSNKIIQTIIFLGIYLFINYILNLGFDIYKIFNLEERYGFNTTTVKTFLKDQFVSLLLSLIIGTSLLYTLLFLYQRLGNTSLIYSWFIILSIILIINVLYTRLFLRLFNKLTPLPQGDLYEKSILLAKDMGYEIRKISVMDASKRSTKLNAFFSGFGKFKSIILYDTLLEKLSTDEIISVLAHEIGHAKNKDVIKNLLISAIQIGGYLCVLSFFLSSISFSAAFGFIDIHYGFAIILFGILLEPVGIILNIPLNFLSRKAEYKADAYAAKAGYKEAMISSLKILAKENFSNLTPHPIVVRLTYSHPTISQRIDALIND